MSLKVLSFHEVQGSIMPNIAAGAQVYGTGSQSNNSNVVPTGHSQPLLSRPKFFNLGDAANMAYNILGGLALTVLDIYISPPTTTNTFGFQVSNAGGAIPFLAQTITTANWSLTTIGNNVSITGLHPNAALSGQPLFVRVESAYPLSSPISSVSSKFTATIQAVAGSIGNTLVPFQGPSAGFFGVYDFVTVAPFPIPPFPPGPLPPGPLPPGPDPCIRNGQRIPGCGGGGVQDPCIRNGQRIPGCGGGGIQDPCIRNGQRIPGCGGGGIQDPCIRNGQRIPGCGGGGVQDPCIRNGQRIPGCGGGGINPNPSTSSMAEIHYHYF